MNITSAKLNGTRVNGTRDCSTFWPGQVLAGEPGILKAGVIKIEAQEEWEGKECTQLRDCTVLQESDGSQEATGATPLHP